MGRNLNQRYTFFLDSSTSFTPSNLVITKKKSNFSKNNLNSDDKYQTPHIIAIEGCQLMMREMEKPHNL